MPETIPVRPGEEIDALRLGEYLKAYLGSGDARLEQFPAGSSNLTYLITAGDAEFVLRRPPFGNTVSTAHDMRREFEVLSKLSAVYPPAPRPVLFCEDKEVIGAEFYLMERRRGLVIRGSAPATLEQDPATQHRVCESFVNTLASLHSLDYAAAGLGDLGRPEGYPQRQVDGWTKRYFAARTDDHPDLEKAIGWLNERIPGLSGVGLVHNDYKFDNIMLDPADLTRVTAVLDWEMVTVGDPLMDLGTTLGYWMSPAEGEEMMQMPFNPRVLMNNVKRRQLAEMYAQAAAADISNIHYYYVFGTFKIAVICQQIYARYVKGATRDKRFAGFGQFVETLGRIAAAAAGRESL